MSAEVNDVFRKPRRTLQFSLRGFVVLMALAAAVMGWWSYWHHRIRKQRVALEEIAAIHARLTKEPNFWISRPITNSVNRTPWWLMADGEKTIPVTTGVSFDLQSYDSGFPERSGLRDRDLQMLAAFPYLYEVNVPRSDVGDEGLNWARPLRRLRRLDLSRSKVTDEDLAALTGLPELRYLRLDGLQLSGEGLAHLALCRDLQSLQLIDVPLTNQGATALNSLASVTVLAIHSQELSQLKLHDLPELHQLSLHLTADEVDLQLTRLPKLHSLTITLEASFSPRRLHLDDLPQLNYLSLQLWKEPEPSLKEFSMQLRGLPALETLQLSSGRVPQHALREISQLPNLRYLQLECETGIDEGAVEMIRPIPKLLHLDLGSSEISDQGLKEIGTISSLRGLDVSSSGTNAGIEALTALPDLRHLHLSSATGDADPGPIFARMPNLQHLSLSNCRFPALRLDGKEHESGLVQLSTLHVEACELAAVEVRHLPVLNDLVLGAPQAKELHIDDLPELHRLDVSLAPTQKVEQFTLRGLPNLRWMSLQCGEQGAEVPADIFEHLLEFKELQSGIVWGLELSPEAKVQLQRLSAQRGVRL